MASERNLHQKVGSKKRLSYLEHSPFEVFTIPKAKNYKINIIFIQTNQQKYNQKLFINNPTYGNT